MNAWGQGRTTRRWMVTLVAACAAALITSACGQATQPQASPASGEAAAAAVTAVAASPSAAAAAQSPVVASSPATARATTVAKPTMLRPGSRGAAVLGLQQRLTALGYWLGKPDGTYGTLTVQAVMAAQKAAGIGRDGVAGPATLNALQSGVRPRARMSGTGVEIDLKRQLLLVVRNGQVHTVVNTSTGNQQVYRSRGQWTRAVTPTGTFRVYRTVNGNDRGPLGDLWRPRYFNGGIAVHGSPSIPAYPASHGCARVSNAAMDMLWAQNLMPVGSTVRVY